MKRYYEKHKCERCGCYYMAFGPASKHCGDCLNEHEHSCKKCGATYKARTLDSKYCGKHRFLQSPAYLAKYATRQCADPEVKRLAKNARGKKYRDAKRVQKVIPAVEVKKERRMLEPVVQMTFRPARETKPNIKIVGAEKPVDKFFLRTGPKTVYGFTSQERMDSFKKRNGIE